MSRLLLSLALLIGCVPASLFARQYSGDQRATRKGVTGAFSHFNPKTAEFDLRNAYLSAFALQVAYATLGLDMLTGDGFEDAVLIGGEQAGDRAVIAANNKILLVLFRASEQESVARLWAHLQEGFSAGDGWEGEACRIHGGCVAAIDDLWGELTETLSTYRRPGQTVWLSGHGLGGSLAVLAAYRLAEDGVPVQGVYTFGQPRVGDSGLARNYAQQLGLSKDGSPLYRIVYEADIVPRLKPPYIKSKRPVTDTLSPYVHFGSLVYVDGEGEISVNPGMLEDLDASIFDLGDYQNHQLATYLTLLSDSLGEEEEKQIHTPVIAGKRRRIER